MTSDGKFLIDRLEVFHQEQSTFPPELSNSKVHDLRILEHNDAVFGLPLESYVVTRLNNSNSTVDVFTILKRMNLRHFGFLSKRNNGDSLQSADNDSIERVFTRLQSMEIFIDDSPLTRRLIDLARKYDILVTLSGNNTNITKLAKWPNRVVVDSIYLELALDSGVREINVNNLIIRYLKRYIPIGRNVTTMTSNYPPLQSAIAVRDALMTCLGRDVTGLCCEF